MFYFMQNIVDWIYTYCKNSVSMVWWKINLRTGLTKCAPLYINHSIIVDLIIYLYLQCLLFAIIVSDLKDAFSKIFDFFPFCSNILLYVFSPLMNGYYFLTNTNRLRISLLLSCFLFCLMKPVLCMFFVSFIIGSISC